MPQIDWSLLHPRHWPIWTGIGLTTLLCYMPVRLRDSICAFIAWVVFKPQSKQIRVARTNLRLCFPDWDEERTERFLRLYFTRYIQVLVQLPYIWWGSRASIWRRVEMHGLHHLEEARKSGAPILLLFNHSMAIDFCAVAMSTKYSMLGIYKAFNNPVIEFLFRHGRIRFGAHVTERGNEMRATLKSLRDGNMLVYICDEDYGRERSVFAPFFGQSKATLTMLPRIAKHSKCKVVPIYTHYSLSSRKMIATFFPALPGISA